MTEISVMREELPPMRPPRRHLLSIDDLTRDDVERLLATARSFDQASQREMKKLPTLRGRTVVNLFFESSTRTSSSFELAAKRLSADVMSIKAARLVGRQGRVAEGHGADAVRLRPGRDRDPPPAIGAPQLVAEVTGAHVVNAGDGKHQHPTQALLDLYTIQQELGRIEGLHVAIVGDVLHSRVARSLIQALVLVRRERDARRAAAADPARDRGDGLRGVFRHRRDRRRRRRLRPAHAARADARGRELRAQPARVHARAGASRPSGCGPARR